MLAVVIAAALTPDVGVVQAQTTGGYVQQSSTNALSPYVIGAIVAVVLAAILVALFFMRRRRPPTAAAPAAVQPWESGGAPGAGPAAPPPSAPPAMAPVAPPPPAAPAYLETPEDVGQSPPVVPAPKAAVAPPPAAAEEGEPDIDSLMAELDKISGEILKRAPKKGSPPSEPPSEGNP